MTVTVNVSIVKNKKLKSLRGLYMHIPLEMQMRSKMGKTISTYYVCRSEIGKMLKHIRIFFSIIMIDAFVWKSMNCLQCICYSLLLTNEQRIEHFCVVRLLFFK